MAREPRASRIRWRLWLGLGGGLIVFVSCAWATRQAYRFVESDPRFVLQPPVLIEGAVYASRARILRVFEGDYGRSVFQAPLAERRRRLLAIDWVDGAVVSRIPPNRLVVRITERVPVAFVNVPLPGGRRGASRPGLIDAHGVLLEQPVRSKFNFPVLRGVAPEQPEADRQRRVSLMLHLLKELGPGAKDVSEINVAAPANVTVVANIDGRALELALGDTNFSSRYQNFVASYAEIRKRSEGITAFDLRQDDRITAKE